MAKKIFLVTLMLFMLPAHAQQLTPPNGLYSALADLSMRLQTPFFLICSEGAACRTNDPRLYWQWERLTHPDSSLGCATFFNAAVVPTPGYRMIFTYEGRIYEYYQYTATQEIFRCTTQGVEFIHSTLPASACPLPPYLAIGTQGRVPPTSATISLYAQPTLTSPPIGAIPANGIFEVVAGPTCAEDALWWRVSFGTVQGWTREATRQDAYLLEPVGVAVVPPTAVPPSQNISASAAPELSLVWSLPLPNFPYDMAYAAAPGWMAIIDLNGLAIYRVYADAVPLLIAPNSAKTYDRVAFSLDGSRLAAAQSDPNGQAEIWVWNTRPVEVLAAAQPFPLNETAPLEASITGKISKLAFNFDGALLAYNTDAALTVQGVNAGFNFSLPTSANFALNPRENLLAVATRNASVELWDIATQALRGTLPINLTEAELGNALAFSPDGTQLAYVSDVNTVTVVNVATLTPLHTLKISNSSPSIIQNIVFGENLIILSTLIPQLDTFDYLFDLGTEALIMRQLGGDGTQAILGQDGTLHWLIPTANGTEWAVYRG